MDEEDIELLPGDFSTNQRTREGRGEGPRYPRARREPRDDFALDRIVQRQRKHVALKRVAQRRLSQALERRRRPMPF
ncbi:MAG TPA: hypothetical protein VFQ25_05890 [Ktedonobacterales bacterium]|nr:hypothetical protein [Ktedonobacterales bacterium]